MTPPEDSSGRGPEVKKKLEDMCTELMCMFCRSAMHAAIERNSWRLPPEDIVQVADPRSKKAQVSEKNFNHV